MAVENTEVPAEGVRMDPGKFTGSTSLVMVLAFGLMALGELSDLAQSGQARADEIEWRAAGSAKEPPPPSADSPSAFKLCKPLPLPDNQALEQTSFNADAASSDARPQLSGTGGVFGLGRPKMLVRAQNPDFPGGPVPGSPPPPVFPGTPGRPPGGPPAVAIPGQGAEEAFNCGVANTNPGPPGLPGKGSNFFQNCLDKCKQGFGDAHSALGNLFKSGPDRDLFRSDHDFDVFTSPVSNPFYFEDPRALTEIRPIFIWQHTPNSNPIYAGGEMFFLGAQGRVAFTPWLSLTVQKLGFIWNQAHLSTSEFSPHVGFSEFHLGPKFTFLRNDTSNTLAAVGLTFEIPSGPAKVFQDTDSFTLRPYVSFGQNFLRSDYGSFNFLNTTGYAAGFGQRTDFFFASFHLDYDVGNFKRLWPLVELNWFHYTMNGSRRSLGFEGADLINFGSDGVAGHDELSLALGARLKINEFIQTGLVGEFSLLRGGRHLNDFRITFDFIFRY